jgi:hypothetical protein
MVAFICRVNHGGREELMRGDEDMVVAIKKLTTGRSKESRLRTLQKST